MPRVRFQPAGSDDELQGGLESSEDECIAIDMFGSSGWSTDWWESRQQLPPSSHMDGSTPSSNSTSGSDLTPKPAGGSKPSGSSLGHIPLGGSGPASSIPHAAAPSRELQSLGEQAPGAGKHCLCLRLRGFGCSVTAGGAEDRHWLLTDNQGFCSVFPFLPRG